MLLCSLWQAQRASDKWPELHLSNTHQPLLSTTSTQEHKPYNYANWDIAIDQERYLLQTNSLNQGQRGFTVYGLGHHKNTNTHILRNLGWVANKDQAQSLLKYSGTILWIQPKGYLLHLAKPNTTDTWPREIAYLDPNSLKRDLPHTLHPLVALSNKALHYQIIHNQEQTIQAIARHLSYSVQFALFALLCIYYQRQLRVHK